MISLTMQQQKLLSFLKEEIGATGIAPSYDEIARHMGLSSKSGVKPLLAGLEMRGRIKLLPRRSRAMEILEAKCPHCGKSL